MNEKLRRYSRLRDLRAAEERLKEAQNAMAVRAVREAEDNIARARAMQSAAAEAGRQGLISGTWNEWWMGESAAAIAERSFPLLQKALVRERQRKAATQHALQQVRQRAEQARLLTAETERALAAEEERRAQAVSDDRFAARTHWTRGQQRRRVVV